MLYNIKVSFIGILEVNLNIIFAITLFIKPPPVTNFMVFY